MANSATALVNATLWNYLYVHIRPQDSNVATGDVPTLRILFCRLLLDLHPLDPYAREEPNRTEALDGWRRAISRALVQSAIKITPDSVDVSGPAAYGQHAAARCSVLLGDNFNPEFTDEDKVFVAAEKLDADKKEAVANAVQRLARADPRWLELVADCAVDHSGWLPGAWCSESAS